MPIHRAPSPGEAASAAADLHPHRVFIASFALALVACAPRVERAPPTPQAPRAAPAPALCALAANERARVPELLAAGRLLRSLRASEHGAALCPERAADGERAELAILITLGRYAEARALAQRIGATEAIEEVNRLDGAPADAAGAEQAAARAEQALAAGDARAAKVGFLEAWSRAHPNGDALAGAARAATALGEKTEARRLFDRALAELARQTGASPSLDLPSEGSGYGVLWTPARLVVVRDSVIEVIDRVTRRLEHRLVARGAAPDAVAVSPDQRTLAALACSGACTLHLVDLATGTTVRRVPVAAAATRGFLFDPRGRFVASADVSGFRAWDVPSGALRFERRIDDCPTLKAIAASPDGAVLAVSCSDNGIRLFSSVDARLLRVLGGTPSPGQTMMDEEGMEFSLLFAPDGKALVSMRYGSGPRLWDVASGRLIRAIADPGGYTHIDGPLDGGRAFMMSGSVGEQVMDLRTFAVLAHREPPGFSPTGDSLERFGCPLYSTFDAQKNVVELRHSVTRAIVLRLPAGDGDEPLSVHCSPDGRELLHRAPDGTLAGFELPSGRTLGSPIRGARAARLGPFAFAPAGGGAALGVGGAVVRSELAGEGETARARMRDLIGLAFSSDGALLAARGRDQLDVLDARTARLLDTIPCAGCEAVAWSPDGHEIALAARGEVSTYKRAARSPGSVRHHLDTRVDLLAYRPARAELVVAGARETRVWDFARDTFERTEAPLEALLPGWLAGRDQAGGPIAYPCRNPTDAAAASAGLARIVASPAHHGVLDVRGDCRRVVTGPFDRHALTIWRLPEATPLVQVSFVEGGARLVQEVEQNDAGEIVQKGLFEVLGADLWGELSCTVGDRVLPSPACEDMLEPGLLSRALAGDGDR